ncbi:MAG: TPM domain-containing protein [Pseudomonadota bacterium]
MVVQVVDLTAAQRADLESAVASVETNTEAELVLVVSNRCGSPFQDALALAAVAALCLPALVWWWFDGSAAALYSTQVLTLFVALLALTQWPGLLRALWPPALQRERVRRHAVEQFHRLGLHRTAHRCGVMVFVSLDERRVEILADVGLDGRVSPATWQRAVNALVARVKRQELHVGLCDAVALCGTALADAAPAGPNDAKTLANAVVLIDN